MSELQARRDAETRRELSSVAIALFAANGYNETTMEAIANAAGVSRRTAYRHYTNKEDLVFERARLWLSVFHTAVAAREPGETTQAVCRRAVLAVAATIEDDRSDVLPGYAVIGSTPALWSRFARSNRDWLDTYTEFLSAEFPSTDPTVGLQVSVLAGALVGGTDRAASHWAIDQSMTLTSLTEQVLDSTTPLWEPLEHHDYD